MNLVDILGNIGFQWQVALANLINFLIIFFILWRFAFRPISQTLARRQKIITDGLDNAKRAETELLLADEKGKELIAEARLLANGVVADGKVRADQLIKEAEEKAKIAAAKVGDDERKRLAQEYAAAEGQLKEESARLVVAGLEKILREEFTAKRQKEYIAKLSRS